MTSTRRNRGFTLIELMIVVMVIAVLAGIAYPSYKNHVLKGHRAAAQAFLMDAAQRQQQYFLDNRAFAPDLATLFGVASPIPTEVDPYYTVTVETAAGPPPLYSVVAVTKGTQISSSEPTPLTINQSGAKSPSTAW